MNYRSRLRGRQAMAARRSVVQESGCTLRKKLTYTLTNTCARRVEARMACPAPMSTGPPALCAPEGGVSVVGLWQADESGRPPLGQERHFQGVGGAHL